jgi:capsular polysaccharide biosynthesis protein
VSEQALDLRTTLAVLRRHRGLLVGAIALGAAAGVAYSMLRLPQFSSTSLVLLPPTTVASNGHSSSRDAATQVKIADSDAVLGPAGSAVRPPLSARQVRERVAISSATDEIVKIRASGVTGPAAKQLAGAVANSYVTFVRETASALDKTALAELATRADALRTQFNTVQTEIDKANERTALETPDSQEGRREAQVLGQLKAVQGDLLLQLDKVLGEKAAGSQPLASDAGAGATVIQVAPGVRPAPLSRLLTWALLGALLAFGIVAGMLLLFARRDRRLRSRDEIADALGRGVIASLQSRSPRGVPGWTNLLQTYDPGTVDGWALRQALRQLARDKAEPVAGRLSHPSSVTIVTLADDPRGLAIGPQVAAFAASHGVVTRLVGAQHQESAAALWAACSTAPDDEVRDGLLVDTHPNEARESELTVVLAVISRSQPSLEAVPPSDALVLAVSSGTATAEDLALLAVAVDEAGLDFDGIIVADPDRLDRSSGRILQQERPPRSTPTRLTGRALEGRARVADFRRRLQ